jgi:GNAT superfamily N-acetyltransferase
MSTQAAGPYHTRELSPKTWRDFEALFGAYGGVQDGCWCMYYHRARPNRGQPDDARHAQNRRDHRVLVGRGEAHGVLVYSGRSAIGWCQFGRTPELPRIDAGLKYRALKDNLSSPPDWRITCFFVDRGHRRIGVARIALSAALDAIQRRGGGIVEAYPSSNPRAVATWFGSVSMFERHAFQRVGPFGRSNVLMRRVLPPARSPRSRG